MIALIAGQGGLPQVVARALQGQDWRLCALEGYVPSIPVPAQTFRIETLGSFIAGLKRDGVLRVCFAGAIARPQIDPSLIDGETMPLVPRMLQALQAGDDAALRTVVGFFEEAGLAVIGAQDIAPYLLPPEGVLVGAMSDQDKADIKRARQVHAALSAVDVGQGCVVAGGQVLAVEALPGTDWMLRSLCPPVGTVAPPKKDPGDPLEWAFGSVSDWLSGPDAPVAGPVKAVPSDFARPSGGILFKGAKPGQDMRIDMPVIGPDTVNGVATAKLNGIVLEAGSAFILDVNATMQAAEKSGIFISVERAWA